MPLAAVDFLTAGFLGAAGFAGAFLAAAVPVSYTHLDVYKRQVVSEPSPSVTPVCGALPPRGRRATGCGNSPAAAVDKTIVCACSGAAASRNPPYATTTAQCRRTLKTAPGA